jgi:glyoxylase-like metal-dependent hydrolase (beta-lactamase superfamily II)
MKGNERTLSNEIYPNIFRICLPFPGKKPGPVNAYLFVGEKVTLLDTGIVRTTKLLKEALGELGLKSSDIDQIIISHGHIDHYGAAKRIVNESDGRAVIAAHLDDIRTIETGWEVPTKRVTQYLRLMGMPLFFRQALRLVKVAFQTLAENCKVDVVLHDGDKIKMGNYEGTVMSTPGHSKGSVCIYLEAENILFSGDHILKHITPNALVMLDPHSEIPERLSQVEFYDSLLKVEGLTPSIVFPAHGNEVANLEEIVSGYRKTFLERQNKILSTLDTETDTVYHIARRVFPNIGGIRLLFEIYLAISEVYTHIQVHQKENRVTTDIKNNKLIIRRQI